MEGWYSVFKEYLWVSYYTTPSDLILVQERPAKSAKPKFFQFLFLINWLIIHVHSHRWWWCDIQSLEQRLPKHWPSYSHPTSNMVISQKLLVRSTWIANHWHLPGRIYVKFVRFTHSIRMIAQFFVLYIWARLEARQLAVCLPMNKKRLWSGSWEQNIHKDSLKTSFSITAVNSFIHCEIILVCSPDTF